MCYGRCDVPRRPLILKQWQSRERRRGTLLRQWSCAIRFKRNVEGRREFEEVIRLLGRNGLQFPCCSVSLPRPPLSGAYGMVGAENLRPAPRARAPRPSSGPEFAARVLASLTFSRRLRRPCGRRRSSGGCAGPEASRRRDVTGTATGPDGRADPSP